MKQEHKNIMNEYWVIFKDYAGMQQNEEGWSDLVEKLTAMHEKYRKSDYEKFAADLFFAFLNEITRLSRG